MWKLIAPSPVPPTQPGTLIAKSRTLHIEWLFSDKVFNVSRPLARDSPAPTFRFWRVLQGTAPSIG
jgi:hypothetical protein